MKKTEIGELAKINSQDCIQDSFGNYFKKEDLSYEEGFKAGFEKAINDSESKFPTFKELKQFSYHWYDISEQYPNEFAVYFWIKEKLGLNDEDS